jgi:hypothetical protein
MLTKTISALIFKLCSSEPSEDLTLTCWDKLINCSQVASEAKVLKCSKNLNTNETYNTYIKKMRAK